MRYQTSAILVISILVGGCSSILTNRTDGCIPENTITSTEEVEFYFIEVDGYSYGSFFPNDPLENNFLCMYDSGGSFGNNCVNYEYLGEKARKLVPGTEMRLDGHTVVKTHGPLERIGGSRGHSTWFRGNIDGKIVWVWALELYWRFSDNEGFKRENIKVYNSLKYDERSKLKTGIYNWNCRF